jgi:DNA/RNA endonuclease YhcR with UshA esterase domain
MQKEEKTIIILLAMAGLSLSIAYLTFSSEYPRYTDDVSVGEHVQASGVITRLRTTNTGGHLIFYLQSNEGSIRCFLPGGAEMKASLGVGEHVTVCGKVSEYRGEREIIVEKECLKKQ